MNLSLSTGITNPIHQEKSFGLFEHFEGSTDVLINEIFFRISFRDFESVGCLNKRLNILTQDNDVLKSMIYRHKTFNQDDWQEHFNLEFPENLAFKMLPHDIGKLFNGPCPLFKGEKLRNTHVFIWMPSGLNLVNCRIFLEKILAGYKDKLLIQQKIIDIFGEQLTGNSKWIIMSKKLLAESNHKAFFIQTKMVNDLDLFENKKYTIPTLFEATICTSVSNLKGDSETLQECYTRCQEAIEEFQILVGRLKNFDVSLSYDRINYNGDPWVNIGIAPVLELKDSTQIKRIL